MIKDEQFYRDMQRYIAVTTIGPSTLRNQGSKGVIEAAQRYLAEVDLEAFRVDDENAFLAVLNTHTERLTRKFPQEAQQPWGAARKALNLFLRDICYNRFLALRHGLSETEKEKWMEIPLDRIVADWLKEKGRERQSPLPPWRGLKGLRPEESLEFQNSRGTSR